jgi:hypothetical protein
MALSVLTPHRHLRLGEFVIIVHALPEDSSSKHERRASLPQRDAGNVLLLCEARGWVLCGPRSDAVLQGVGVERTQGRERTKGGRRRVDRRVARHL